MQKSMQALPSLDVHVQIQENELHLNVWRKETNTGILINFNAICPNVWKSSLELCLLVRAKSICSSQHLFESRWESRSVYFMIITIRLGF